MPHPFTLLLRSGESCCHIGEYRPFWEGSGTPQLVQWCSGSAPYCQHVALMSLSEFRRAARRSCEGCPQCAKCPVGESAAAVRRERGFLAKEFAAPSTIANIRGAADSISLAHSSAGVPAVARIAAGWTNFASADHDTVPACGEWLPERSGRTLDAQRPQLSDRTAFFLPTPWRNPASGQTDRSVHLSMRFLSFPFWDFGSASRQRGQRPNSILNLHRS